MTQPSKGSSRSPLKYVFSRRSYNSGSFDNYRARVFIGSFIRALAGSAATFFGLVVPAVLSIFDERDSVFTWSVWSLGLAASLTIALVGALVARHKVRRQKFQLGTRKAITVNIAGYWESVDEFRTPTTALVFGVHDRLTKEELKTNSLHAQFRKEYLASSPDCDQDLELEYAKKVVKRRQRVLFAKEFRLKYGTVVPLIYPLTEERTLEAAIEVEQQRKAESITTAHRAYMLVNSTLAKKIHPREPHVFHSNDAEDKHSMVPRYYENLFETIQNDFFPVDSVIVPLIGTGYSSFSVPTASVYQLINCYFDYLLSNPRGGAKVDHLIISLHPNDVVAQKVDLEAIHQYIRARTAIYERML